MRTVLYGTNGTMKIYDDPDMAVQVYLKDRTRLDYDAEPALPDGTYPSSGVIDLWMDCLIHDKAPEISGESGLSAMRAVFAAIRSSETGMAVEIPENR